jgi:exosortase/archaeosortase family protein
MVLEMVPELITGTSNVTVAEAFMEQLRWWDLAFFIPALILMGYSYKDRGSSTNLFRAAGMGLFGLFWFSQVAFFLDPAHTDVINGMMSLLGGIFFIFVGFHFYLDHRWDENTKSIQWLLRTSVLTGGAYFIFEHIPITQGALIYIVAWPTYWLLRLFGHNVTIDPTFPSEYGSGMVIESGQPFMDLPIRIVFACTAALALFLFVSAVVATRTNKNEWKGWAKKEIRRLAGSKNILEKGKRNGIKNIMRMSDRQRKIYAIALVVPIIFVSNLFRNVAVIAATFTEIMTFEDAHNVYAKILALGMMIYLTWILFELLPELQEDVMGLFDLTKRVKKGMMKDGRLDLKYIQRSKGKKERN